MEAAVPKLGGQAYGADHRVAPMQESGQRQLGPALPEVGRAAAIVRLQPEQVRVRAVGAEHRFAREGLAGHLVAHLHILVRPHVVAARGGQGVEGRKLQPFEPFFVAGAGVELLVRIHLLHNRA